MKDSIVKILKERYFLPNETTWEDIAKRVSVVYEPIKEHINNLEFIPSSPTLMNCNTKGYKSGTLSSCFTMNIEDSIEGIFEAIKEAAIVTKNGGGVGYDFSTLRGSNEIVEGIGRPSSGPLPFINVFNSTLDGIMQGGVRRGAGMGMLDVDSSDILNFIEAKSTPGAFTRLNFSVRLTDKFYKQLEEEPDSIWFVKNRVDGLEYALQDKDGNSVTVKKLWDIIIDKAWGNAEPGIFNSDIAFRQCSVTNVNKHVLSNPCLRDSVMLLTSSGNKSLKDINIGDEIWSKEGWATVVAKFPTGKKEVFQYHTTAGVFESTANHEIVSNGVKIPVGEAENIDVLVGSYEKRNNILYPELIMDGLVIGDGSYHKASNNKVFLYIGENDKDYFTSEIEELLLKNREPGLDGWEVKTSISYDELPKTFDRFIPQRFFEMPYDMRASFLRGLYSANGSIVGERISYKTTSFKMVNDLQKMLSSIGIHSYYTTNKAKSAKFRNGIYECKVFFDVNITTDSDKFLESIGFIQDYKSDKLIKILDEKSQVRKPKENYDIIAVESIGVHNVWDITVDNNSHTFWCDGFNVSNCQEYISIPYGSCNLGSINISKLVKNKKFNWDDFEDLIVKATRYLNSIIDINKYPIKKIKDTTLSIRPIGMGYMGIAHALFKKEIPYNSDKGYKFIEEVTRYMTLRSMQESVELAKQHGSYPAFDLDTFMNANERFFTKKSCRNIDVNKLKEDIKKYGVRNSVFTSIAPTGTISFIADASSGIEPVFALTYTRKIEKENKVYETVYISDPVFDKYLLSFNEFDREKILNYISEHNGSCQGCSLIPKEMQKVFVVASDIIPMDHLEALNRASVNCSTSVSKTINLPKDISKEEVANVYIEAYKKGIIGVTVYRDGSREGILVHNIKEDIIERNAPKRPKELPCHVYKITVKGDKWIVFIGIYHNHPYEVFAGKIGDLDISSSIESGILERIKSGHYIFKKEDGTILVENVTILFTNDEQEALTRQISTNLRHGTPIDFIIQQLEKSHGTIVDFNKAILRALRKYQKNKDGGICEHCGGKLIYFDGCLKCSNPECGFSKCG